MVRPVNSKRKLFITNKEQYKENEPGQLSSSKSSDLPVKAGLESPCIYQVHQSLNKKISSQDSIRETRTDKVAAINSQRRCDFEDAGNILTPGRAAMPMSERQQIALLMQMSSPSPTNKADISISNPCTTPTSASFSRGATKRNERGETPLHVSAIKGDAEKVSQLISEGANVNATDYAGWTALHEACNRGFIVIASLLIKAGADVNAKGLDNDTPLHDACVNNHHKIVELLLKSGAKTDHLNKRGKSPRDVCRSPRILSLIEKADAGEFEGFDCNDLDLPFSTPGNHLGGSFYLEKLSNPDGPYFTTVGGDFAQNEMSRRTSPNSKPEEKSSIPTSGGSSTASAAAIADSDNSNNNNNNATCSNSNGRPSSPRVTQRLPLPQKTPDKTQLQSQDSKEVANAVDVYEFQCGKDEVKAEGKDDKSEMPHTQENTSSVPAEPKGDKRPRESGEAAEEEEMKKKRKKEDNKVSAKVTVPRTGISEKNAKSAARNSASNSSVNKQAVTPTTSASGTGGNANSTGITSVATTGTTSVTVSTSGATPTFSNTTSTQPSSSVETRKSPSGSAANSPKAAVGIGGKSSEKGDSDNEDMKSESGAPKVPPLKIVLAPSSTSEQEPSTQNGKNGNGRPLLYVVNSSSGSPEEPVEPHDQENKEASKVTKEEPEVVTSTSVTITTSSSTVTTVATVVGSNNGVFLITSGSPPITSNSAPITSSIISSSNGTATTTFVSYSGQYINNNATTTSTEKATGLRVTRSRFGGNEDPPTGKTEVKVEEPSTGNTIMSEVVHPRKRKLKVKEPEVEQPSTSLLPEQPITNCYEMFLRIRRQVERRRKLLFPVQPKPPQGFKDYLMNRCSYILANSSNTHLTVPIVPPPPTVAQPMIELFNEQEQERHKLKLQQLIEKEKLVLSVEQEILRVHGRAARALANQVLPFSVCTILKDEEVYNVISAEQEEKDRNARSRYNGRLFLSWLQDVDDKWEKIKEAMVLRHHNEAESLHAVQKMDWEWKQREMGLVEPSVTAPIDELHVPMVQVADFDLLPA